ncbi:hypothetical protein LWI28_012500 [Acer negundo]|uniref:Uncharacterized protein n=1 Tax=Acer negundo TaxID=4023 RepID=A0AAD5I980_ACENE|nr:hypothetical protein LWI28_012500 [Acer negundo]
MLMYLIRASGFRILMIIFLTAANPSFGAGKIFLVETGPQTLTSLFSLENKNLFAARPHKTTIDKDLPMKCCNGTYVEWKTTMMSSKHLTKRDKYKISVKDLAYLALFFIYDDLV